MSVRKQIHESYGVYFITFTCARWLPLFQLTDGYPAVYKWFDYLKLQGHHIVAYVIMPSHVHAIIAFRNTTIAINTIIGNGKRFMAYELVNRLKQSGNTAMLQQLAAGVNKTQRLINKKHQVFEPSFDRKECFSIPFMKQKADYIHLNPCKPGWSDYLRNIYIVLPLITIPDSREYIRLSPTWNSRTLIFLRQVPPESQLSVVRDPAQSPPAGRRLRGTFYVFLAGKTVRRTKNPIALIQ